MRPPRPPRAPGRALPHLQGDRGASFTEDEPKTEQILSAGWVGLKSMKFPLLIVGLQGVGLIKQNVS